MAVLTVPHGSIAATDVRSPRTYAVAGQIVACETGAVPQPTVRVRRARTDDLGGVLRADHIAAGGDRERIEFIKRSLYAGQCLACAAGGTVIGFVIVTPGHFYGRDFMDLLVVDPARRRTGIGRSLLRAGVAAAATDQVFTSTNVSNHAMRSLLRAEGWTFSGELSGLDQGDNELVYYTMRRA